MGPLANYFPECRYGDHDYRKSPTCARCGERLRCGSCGRFIAMDGSCRCFDTYEAVD